MRRAVSGRVASQAAKKDTPSAAVSLSMCPASPWSARLFAIHPPTNSASAMVSVHTIAASSARCDGNLPCA